MDLSTESDVDLALKHEALKNLIALADALLRPMLESNLNQITAEMHKRNPQASGSAMLAHAAVVGVHVPQPPHPPNYTGYHTIQHQIPPPPLQQPPQPLLPLPPLLQSQPRLLRAGELSDDAAKVWCDKITKVVMGKYNKVIFNVRKTMDPTVVIGHVLDAITKDQRAGVAGSSRGNSAFPHAQTNHVVLINGEEQRGKTDIKVLEAVTVYEINQDTEVADKPYTIMVTIMVAWARQLHNNVSDRTCAANMTFPDEFLDADDEQQYNEDVNDDDDVDLLPPETMPIAYCPNLVNFSNAMAVAMKGGAIIIPRSNLALEKAIKLNYLVNKKSVREHQGVRRWPLLALDEVDKMLGTQTTALGGRSAGDKAPMAYEVLFNMLCGFEDLPPTSAPILVSHGRHSYDAVKAINSPDVITESIKKNLDIPFLISGISATNVGFFCYAMQRAFIPHKTSNRTILKLLDNVSFDEADAEDYRGLDEAVRYKDQLLQPHGETTSTNYVHKGNKWTCPLTLAIESDAAQDPGSCMMVCTTPTVSEGTKSGISMQEVHSNHVVRTLLGKRLNAVEYDQSLGYTYGGQWTVFMHGGCKTFLGMLGLAFVAPDDPFGLRMLAKFVALCDYHAPIEHNAYLNLDAQLLNMEEGTEEHQRVKAEHAERHNTYFELIQSGNNIRARIDASKPKAVLFQADLEDVVRKWQETATAEATYKEADRRYCRGADGHPTSAQLDKLKQAHEKLKTAADDKETKLIAQYHRAVMPFTKNDNTKPSFGQLVLRPLIAIWERGQHALNSVFARLVDVPPPGVDKATSMNTVHIIRLLGFLRSFDSMLAPLGAMYAPRTDSERSANVPLKVMGQGMIRRAMSIIAAAVNADTNMAEVVSTVSHVVQFANHDCASQDQAIRRYNTTATVYRRGRPVKVLTSFKGWVSMHGHRAYNTMPEWRKSPSERKAWIARFNALAVRGGPSLPEVDTGLEDEINALLKKSIPLDTKGKVYVPDRQDILTMHILIHMLHIPADLARMCQLYPSPFFAGVHGRHHGYMLHRVSEGQRLINPLDADQLTFVPPEAAKPKKKKKDSKAMTPEQSAELNGMLMYTLKAMGAYGDDAANDCANAVTHNDFWVELCALHAPLLRDPVQLRRLQKDNNPTLLLLDREREGGKNGGIQRQVENFITAGGPIRILHNSDPRNRAKKNLYYLSRPHMVGVTVPRTVGPSSSGAGSSGLPPPRGAPGQDMDEQVALGLYHKDAEDDAWAQGVQQGTQASHGDNFLQNTDEESESAFVQRAHKRPRRAASKPRKRYTQPSDSDDSDDACYVNSKDSGDSEESSESEYSFASL